jgi:hypothetical protein
MTPAVSIITPVSLIAGSSASLLVAANANLVKSGLKSFVSSSGLGNP